MRRHKRTLSSSHFVLLKRAARPPREGAAVANRRCSEQEPLAAVSWRRRSSHHSPFSRRIPRKPAAPALCMTILIETCQFGSESGSY
jgi:hypothetical protein